MENFIDKIKQVTEDEMLTNDQITQLVESISEKISGIKVPFVAAGIFSGLITSVMNIEMSDDVVGREAANNIVEDIADSQAMLLLLQDHYGISNGVMNKALAIKLKEYDELMKENKKKEMEMLDRQLEIAKEKQEKYS